MSLGDETVKEKEYGRRGRQQGLSRKELSEELRNGDTGIEEGRGFCKWTDGVLSLQGPITTKGEAPPYTTSGEHVGIAHV